MKRILIGIAALVVIGAGCIQPETPVNTTKTQIYRNSTYGFSFAYPTEMEFVTPSYPLLQDTIVELSLPHEKYPNTNFGDAAFSVSASYTRSLTECLAQNAPENSDGFKEKAIINGTEFYTTTSTGAAAGNRYFSTVYRTFTSERLCLELLQTIHTTVIENYPPGTVTEVNVHQVQNRLDRVLETFRFAERN